MAMLWMRLRADVRALGQTRASVAAEALILGYTRAQVRGVVAWQAARLASHVELETAA